MRANCPSCGAELTLRFSSLVCRQCRAVVARSGASEVRAVGQAALFQSQSALSLGMQGALNQPFTLCGHVQFQHPAGGVWDEWYAVFADGRFGWLAEAQGKFFMTFHSATQQELPGFDSFFPAQQLRLPSGDGGQKQYTVNERGVARVIAAEGDIPYVLHVGESYQFVDLSGPSGEFATINYREAMVFDSEDLGDAIDSYRQAPSTSTVLRPHLYVGREYSLSALSLTANTSAATAPLSCPSCQGELSLQTPDTAERIACPACGAVSALVQGQAQRVGQSPRATNIEIPLGTQASFEGKLLLVIGYLRRSGLFDGERFGWEEYLLYHKDIGFRWLVKGEKGWSYVKPVNPGEVSDESDSATYNGSRFRLDESCRARVDIVVGEFYWKVTVGEEVSVSDYVYGAETLSREKSEGEINWSHGRALSPATVEQATGLNLLAPNALYNDYSGEASSGSSAVVVWIVVIFVILLLIVIMDSCDGDGGGGGGFFYGGGFRGGK